MTDERIEGLEAKIAALTAEVEELKAKTEPEKPFVSKPMPKYDPTEGMGMPASAMREMARLIPDPPKKGGFNAHAWSQTRMGQPGGFGPGPGGKWDTGSAKVRPEDEWKP